MKIASNKMRVLLLFICSFVLGSPKMRAQGCATCEFSYPEYSTCVADASASYSSCLNTARQSYDNCLRRADERYSTCMSGCTASPNDPDGSICRAGCDAALAAADRQCADQYNNMDLMQCTHNYGYECANCRIMWCYSC
jgi:hypothetical protein